MPSAPGSIQSPQSGAQRPSNQFVKSEKPRVALAILPLRTFRPHPLHLFDHGRQARVSCRRSPRAWWRASRASWGRRPSRSSCRTCAWPLCRRLQASRSHILRGSRSAASPDSRLSGKSAEMPVRSLPRSTSPCPAWAWRRSQARRRPALDGHRSFGPAISTP